jgi:hypothetical protein
MNESIVPDKTNTSEESSERPTVISVIAVIMFLNGIVTLASGVMYEAGPLVLASGAVAILLSLGLWKLWSWSWLGTILLQIVALGTALYYWYTLGSINFWAIGIAIIIIWYLLRSETRSVFFN